MTGFLISAIVVSVTVASIWLGDRAMKGDRLATVGLCFILSIIIFGLVHNSIIKSEAKGPCHKYETKMMYNVATKTMMPSRVCVLCGEWVEEERDESK